MLLRTLTPMAILAILISGCASRPDYPTFGLNPCQQLAIRSIDRFEAAPLFDAEPSRCSAEAFNYRSDWPSTMVYYSPGEITEYRLYQIDHQGRGFYGGDYTHRWAQTRRYSLSYR